MLWRWRVTHRGACATQTSVAGSTRRRSATQFSSSAALNHKGVLMRFLGTTANIIYLILGIVFAVLGLLVIVGSLALQDYGTTLYGVILLLLGGARIAWSIVRMRAFSAIQQRQRQQQQQQQMFQPGYPPYPQQPGAYPPQYPPYPQQPGAYPPPYGAPGQVGAQPGAYPPAQYPPAQYPPQPGVYQSPYPPQGGQQ